MDPFTPVLDYIQRYVSLTEAEEQAVAASLKLTRLRKRQQIVQPGFVCGHRSYIVEGSMRSYVVDAEGAEHVFLLAIEDWWISDFHSYFFQKPATFL